MRAKKTPSFVHCKVAANCGARIEINQEGEKKKEITGAHLHSIHKYD